MNDEGVYQRKLLQPPSELVSLSCNIARTEDGNPFTHIHCCWSDNDLNAHAGHMFECVVAVVAEIHIRIMEELEMYVAYIMILWLKHLWLNNRQEYSLLR